MAQLRLREDNPRKYVQTLKCGQLRRGESAELSADNIVSYLGSPQFDVILSEEEIEGLSDKKLALAQRLLGLNSREEVISTISPEKAPSGFVQKTKAIVNSVTPTLNRKVVTVETSDEADSAYESE